MAKSRARPAAAEDSAVPPPAKRRKPLPDARSTGFEDILLSNKKAGKKLAPAHTTKSRPSDASRVNDEGAVVNTPNGNADVIRSRPQKPNVDTISISSDDSSDDFDLDEDRDGEQDNITRAHAKVEGAPNGVEHNDDGKHSEDEDAADVADNISADENDGDEATFGERLAAQQAEPIDVEAALIPMEGEATDKTSKVRQLIPTGATFSTVLTQALRTNDTTLLESCFETHDLESVRNTLSRIDSTLVIGLMTKIAEKISRRPGRLGNLMVWIQWIIIAHGGYLAGQPDVVKQLAVLQRVIKARADGLQPLLQLKGKLDMLSAQLDLRRDILERNARNEEEEVTIYVEGEEDDNMEVSDEESEGSAGEQRLLLKGFGGADASDSDEEDAEMGVFSNGIVKGDAESSGDSDAEEGLFDDEAEETDDDEESESDDEAASDEEDSD
ncbi:uncharacterized protein PV09_02714 [Verruconis gallopava]|uniref:Small-subunit processome Utp12 domain-containing protein n=1 Tax=Verruconis gallopava TaxID=253628 RepID=A0A0D2AI18_9PEZI|nr:uncharacterized protein PV09_02714 [Verruconis gallopava]KIW06240.1 hypothetical protein PV09_02714 [Verruconis gallopava]